MRTYIALEGTPKSDPESYSCLTGLSLLKVQALRITLEIVTDSDAVESIVGLGQEPKFFMSTLNVAYAHLFENHWPLSLYEDWLASFTFS